GRVRSDEEDGANRVEVCGSSAKGTRGAAPRRDADAAASLPVNSVLHPLDGLVEQPGPRSAGRAALIRLAIYDPWPLPNDEDANCSRRQSRMLSDLFRCLTSVLLLGSCLSFSYLVGCGLNRTATTSVRLCAT